MRPVAPRIVGLEEVHIDGEKYKLLPAAKGETDEGHPSIVTRWRVSDEERIRLARGEDIFLCVIGERIQPLQLHVGWPYGEIEL